MVELISIPDILELERLINLIDIFKPPIPKLSIEQLLNKNDGIYDFLVC